jgi:hypothetical protein
MSEYEETPDYPSPAGVGAKVRVKGYCYTNPFGGTEICDRSAVVRITKSWWDYECGWRYWADLKKQRVFVSEFDIVK